METGLCPGGQSGTPGDMWRVGSSHRAEPAEPHLVSTRATGGEGAQEACAHNEEEPWRSHGSCQSWARDSHTPGRDPLWTGAWSLGPLLSLGQEWGRMWGGLRLRLGLGCRVCRSAAPDPPFWGQLR